MASCPSTTTKLTLLSLPDDALGRIFKCLAITDKYTLQSSKDAINLANTNTRLLRIFSAQLTHITPLVESTIADTLSPQRFETLLRIAGKNLRQLNISECHHSYLYHLPTVCPNLEALHVVERFHTSDELPFGDTDEDEESYTGEDDQESDENDIIDEELGDGDIVGPHASANEIENSESGENNVTGNEGSDFNIADNDNNDTENSTRETNGGDDTHQDTEDDHRVDQDEGCNAAVAIARNPRDRCPIPEIIPRLNLRKLSVVRLPRKLCTSIMNILNHSLQELHLYSMRKHQLPLLTPLFSHRLKALTVTTNFEDHPRSERVSKLIDALTSAVLHIPSVTVHISGSNGLNTIRESASNIHSLHFPDEAASLIASARRNTCESECTKISLAGNSTYSILSSVNRNACISLTDDKITVCDRGEGMFMTSVPLYDEFLDVDLTHLERAHIIQRSCMEEEDFIEHGWSPEWGNRLAGHRLSLIRCCDANALNKLKLSTRVLEFFGFSILNMTDWSCLTGVEELYVLGPSMGVHDHHLLTIESFLEALSGMIDAFRGEFICVGFYLADFRGCSDPEMALQNAYEVKKALHRFVTRGGDAATVSTYIDAVIDNLKTVLKGA